MAIVQSFVVEHPRTVGVVASVGVVIILAWRMRPRPGPNPFRKDGSRPSRPLVTDKAARNKVLKQGFSSKAVPTDLDAIVIGSGPGGLTAAVLLSKAGKRVLVLEQHDQAGGCCHSFEEQGYEFDSGIHYVGDMTSSRMVGCLFSQLTEGQVEWAPLVPDLDVLALGEPGQQKFFSFISGSRDTWKQGLLKSFPDEEPALDKYIAKLKVASSTPLFVLKLIPKPLARLVVATGLIHLLSSYFKYASLSLQDVLDEVTDNRDLQAALAFNLGDYGTPPSKSSFMMHAMLTNYYTYGAYYPRGGSSEIAFHMIPVIERSGGRVLVRARVTEILTDDNCRAIGVKVGKSKDADIFAPMIISDAGVLNTLQTLLPRTVAAKSSIYKYLGSELRNGVSIIQLFVGLKGSPEELGVKAQNIWAYTDNNINAMFDKVQTQSASDAASSTVPVMFLSFPTAKDPSREQRFPGKCACAVVTFANWQWFCEWEKETQGKRGAEYENLKKEFAEQMWAQVLALYPQLKDKVEYFNLGSPLTGQHYLAAPQGEGYGLDHCRARFSTPEVVINLRPDIGIPGLLLTGQDVTMCGLAGGMMGGLVCASRALNRNLFSDIMKLTNSIAKKQ